MQGGLILLDVCCGRGEILVAFWKTDRIPIYFFSTVDQFSVFCFLLMLLVYE